MDSKIREVLGGAYSDITKPIYMNDLIKRFSGITTKDGYFMHIHRDLFMNVVFRVVKNKPYSAGGPEIIYYESFTMRQKQADNRANVNDLIELILKYI